MDVIRNYRTGDAAAVLELNASNRPEVSALDATRLAWYAAHSPFFRVVVLEESEVGSDPGAGPDAAESQAGDVRPDQPVGFFVGLTDEQSDYDSPNFGWFSDRHREFAYVDRIALAESARGRGIGPALYRAFEQWSVAARKPVLCAEVNTIPPNPRSLRFHRLAGFVEVGRLRPYGPDQEESMLEKLLPGR